MRAAGAVGAIYVTSLGFFTLPVLFVRLLRPLMPGLTIQTLFGLAGRVGRPVDPTERADQAVLLYLVPLTLVLAGVALGRANRSLLARVGSALLGSHGPGWAMLALAGGLSGWSILEGVPAPASASPFDPLALCAVPVAALLAGAGVMLLAAPAAGAPGRLPVPDGMVRADPGPVRGDAATGTALLACAWVLAAAASVPSAACLAMALGAATLGRGSASLLPRAIGAPQLAAGVAALGAFLAGYAVTAGAEALVLLPAPLLAIVLASGFLADVPSMRRPRAVASNRAAAWLAAASAGAAPIMVLAGTAFAVGDAPGLVAALVAGAFAAGSLLFARVIDAPLLASLALTGAAAMVGLATTAPASLPAWREMALSSPTYYMRLSQNVEAAGDLERAAGAAAEAVRRAPGTASTHQRLGLVRARRGDMAGALEAFRKASSLSPEEGSIQVNLASALIQTGAPGEALERLDAAIARSTGTATALFNRARALDDLGRHAEAESAWREYLKLAQGRPEEASTVEFAHRRLAAGPGRPGPRGGH
jgi:tetratricopeptide (TPR) repeat protein